MKVFNAILMSMVIAGQCALSPTLAQENTSQMGSQVRQLADGNDIVMFNPKSLKYHIPSCAHAKRCTHCIKIKRSEAKSRGGVPCKVCGAGES